MTKKLFTLKDLAMQLKVAPHRITYLITSGKVSEPKLRLGNTRVFTHEEVADIAKQLTKHQQTLIKKENND